MAQKVSFVSRGCCWAVLPSNLGIASRSSRSACRPNRNVAMAILAMLPRSTPQPRPPRSAQAWIRVLALSCAEVYTPALAILSWLAMLPRSTHQQRSNALQFEATIATFVRQTLPSLPLLVEVVPLLRSRLLRLSRQLEAELAFRTWEALVMESSATHVPLLRLPLLPWGCPPALAHPELVVLLHPPLPPPRLTPML